MRPEPKTHSIHAPHDLTVFFMVGVVLIAYVAFALSPSSYQLGLQLLGVDAKPFFGMARSIRSDEWIVYTPLVQIAVRSGFAPLDLVSPYHESLKSFIALPILDWSLIFKPQLWAYWVLPPAYAYSLYFGLMWASFILGYFVLLRQLRVPTWIAFFGAQAFFWSHFVQVWWTNNAPALALAPWPAVIFLSRLSPLPKTVLLFWATAVWAFGLVYPPFQIPTAFALLVLMLSFRVDTFTRTNLFVGLGAGVAAGLVFYLYFGDLIEVMRSTVYPGQRSSDGGSVPLLIALANFIPFLTTAVFTPLLSAFNECEIAAATTLIPLMLVVFARYDTAKLRLADIGGGVIAIAIGLGLMAAWMLLPVPSAVGRFLLWNYVPPMRMLFAFGLLLTMACVVIGARLDYEVTFKRAALFIAILAGKFALTTLLVPAEAGVKVSYVVQRTWFDGVAVAILAILIIVVKLNPRRMVDARIAVFAAAALMGTATFGTFNPVQSARPIFNIPPSPFQNDLRARARENPNGWLIVPGMYGAVLNGAGIPAINHTLMTPQLPFFQGVFPEMAQDQFNEVFNRYAHIVPKSGDNMPQSPQGDVIYVPLAPFETRVGDGQGAPQSK